MQLKRTTRAVRRPAFTLMEMLAVMTIIVILAGISLVVYSNYVDDARINKAKIQSKELVAACKNFQIKYSRYPESLHELMSPPDGSKSYLDSEEALMDPWQQPYQYQIPGTHNLSGAPDVWSNGPPGENKPVGSW
jgi:general secretion pathway protein G